MLNSGDFQFFVLNNKASWEKGLACHVNLDDTGMTIEETREYVKEAGVGNGLFPAGLKLKDFAVGPCRLIYLLDTAGWIWVYDPVQKWAERIECIRCLFQEPGHIAYSPETLFVSDQQENKIYALARINWQIRWIVGPVPETADEIPKTGFTPVSITADSAGNLFILTPYEPAIGRLAVVKIDQSGKIVPGFDLKFEVPAPVDLSLIGKYVFVQVSGGGSVCILDSWGKRVLKYSPTGNKVWEYSDWTAFPENPAGFGVDTEGNLFIGEGGTLGGGSDQERFIHKYSPSGAYLGAVSFYRGHVEKLQVDKGDRIFVYNGEEGNLTVLKPEKSYYRSQKSLLPAGTYFSRAFENPFPEIPWHKVLLDGGIPDNTQVKVSYLISNEKQFAIKGEMHDLDDYLSRAAELPVEEREGKVEDLNSLAWSAPLVNPGDALIHGPAGRYLWLRIELTGSERDTPLLKSIRVYYPRDSYLRYLPAVYREDEQSRDFLERFLSLFETFFSRMDFEIGHIERYLDAEFVTGDFLRWLGSWLSIAVDENWTDEKLRLLIKKAPALYKKRGTREGIQEIIRVYTGDKPFIIEHFQLRCAQAEEESRELMERLYGADPYEFCVLLKPFQVKTGNERLTVRRIIDGEKPAYTQARVVHLEPWIYLDMHTYLEVNTYLSKPVPALDSGAVMPRDTVLGDIDEAGQVERRSRIGLDTGLT
ncbi:MAG: hypothetical protein CVU89_06650 [Firmicutes bacterium HGW-Firmicutes-14]|nr:MAG: hypothetical protein CVU89_06650 [Firmicutes bacterium HGW-Firmicutes-14]